MKTRIIVDSTADLAQELKNRVHTVPMTVTFGDEEFIDGVTIDHKTFYEKLIESDVLPKTSQATPDAFAKEFEKAKEAGEAAVVLTISSKLSGTYQSAMIAADDYENIYVVDAGSVAMGNGILAEYALRLADEGKDAAEIFAALEEAKKAGCAEDIAELHTGGTEAAGTQTDQQHSRHNIDVTCHSKGDTDCQGVDGGSHCHDEHGLHGQVRILVLAAAAFFLFAEGFLQHIDADDTQ